MRRNTSSNCGNPQSFTLSKLLRVFLVLLVLLAFSYGNAYKMRRNTALRSVFPWSCTASTLPAEILARLVLLAFSYGYKYGLKNKKKGGRYRFTAPC